MKENSNDLYAQIIKKLEEKERNEGFKSELSSNVDEFIDSTDDFRTVACKVKKNDKPIQKKNKKSGDKKMRKLLLVLIFLQILLLGTMLYLLYDKIFDSNFKIDTLFSNRINYEEEIELEDFGEEETSTDASINQLLKTKFI